ncbi:DNA-directed DNA polymerase, partial [Tanacetum coccineum]
MPKYAKYMKSLLANKSRFKEACTITMNERCSAALLNRIPSKEKDPKSFTIPCRVGDLHIKNALANLGASISLMPYVMYKKLGIGEPKPTRISLELADRSIQYPIGIAENMLIKVDKFDLPIDFVILDMPEDSRIPSILGRPFLATARAMIDVFNKKITLKVGDEQVIFDIESSMKKPNLEDDSCYNVDKLDDVVAKLVDYAYLDNNKSRLVIISSKLSTHEKKSLLYILERIKGTIAWKMSDIKGLIPSFCTHKILTEDDFKPTIQPQRRLNPRVQDVVKDEIVKLLDSGLIYPILDSSWVSPIHVEPKKGGMTVVLNDDNELIPSRTVTRWRVCIDYRKLNYATRKDHFPLPFIDQMLERLSGNDYYCFLDGFSGFFQIPITPEDQGKTTFTCPYRTFAYRIMPFGLYNALATSAKLRAKDAYDRHDISDMIECLLDTKRLTLFIEDFSMIAKPMMQLLMKDAKFDFTEECKKTFNILKEKLTTVPIIISLDWKMNFKLICDASDFAVGVVLGHRIGGRFKPIYYTSKTLNEVQEHYSTKEKELLAVVFAFDKFQSYLILSKTVVYTNHSALKYLFSKQDAKSRLI